ncbi:MAG TPA: DUF2062 domain-containing protein [Chromatiales bacterium]|nr:DUF2062 domain-containing protein [Chromatiales bacterium]HEX22744.1 DUF2062 domain-containing protein [Chromatiales bacterium]
MPRRIIKRYLPDPQKIRDHKCLRCLGPLRHDPNILHLNRHSVSGAFAVGLFFAFWPVPLQMLLAAIGAILVRVNLPISVTLVWITNPITIPPIFYFSYLVGTWVLGTPALGVEFEFTAEWIAQELSLIWKPLFLGSLICGTVSAATGYITIQIVWRRLVQRSWDRRCRRRRAARRKDAADAFQAEVEKD